MRIALAQIQSFPGDINRNIEKHLSWVEKLEGFEVDALFFPELSLMGYEPKYAKEKAVDKENKSFIPFTKISNQLDLCIGLGIPLQKEVGIEIGMVIFQPNVAIQTYSKIFLHQDELPYFVPGIKYKVIKIGNEIISPAICYESMVPKHHQKSISKEGQIYLASVAKSKSAMEKAIHTYYTLAKEYRIHVLVVNAWGPNDDFFSGGKSSVWNPDGVLSGQILDANEGILIYDTTHNQTTILNMQ